MKNRFLFGILFSIIFYSCGADKESDARPPISAVPEITKLETSPLEVNQFETITFTISYTDGDGDIGTEDADDFSLEILDNRENILNSFHIPPQSPGSGIVISGVLIAEVENLILLDQSNNSESVTFNVRLRDRQGNWSKTITSETVTVSK